MKNSVSTRTQTGPQNLEFALSDASGIAEAALRQALDFCAAKLGLVDHTAVIERLRQDDRTAYGYFYYGLAEQTADWLGSWDQDIRAVYLFDYDATADDICFGNSTPLLLHLILWTRRKTNALDALLSALDRALAQCCADAGIRRRRYLLDAHIVDDDEIHNSVGCGAMLSSVHTHPIRVWER
jgi:hypothetical protein